MKSLIALSCVGLASLIAQVSSVPVSAVAIPAFINPVSGEVLVRAPRDRPQLGDRPQASSGIAIPAFLNPESGEVLVRAPRQLGDRPQAFRPLRREDNEDISFADQDTAADSSYNAAPVAPLGRVKIQVYRGPSQGSGYDSFAPWGYYNTQPLDADKYH